MYVYMHDVYTHTKVYLYKVEYEQLYHESIQILKKKKKKKA